MEYPTLARAAIVRPDRLGRPSTWNGHVPFAIWLVESLKPKVIVELGTHYGISYFNFCRAVKAAGLTTKCYAIDTWEGDEHAGHYGEAVFTDVHQHNETNYPDISRLLRMKFDEAVDYFSDGSIDLLHIDGLHTYDAVKNDFERWLPKLTPSAVVLFHDTNVKEREFGIWRFWEELARSYPLSLEFVHSHGLGVLQLTQGSDSFYLDWLAPESLDRRLLVEYFSARGAEIEQQYTNHRLLAERDATIAQLQHLLAERDATIAQPQHQLAQRDRQINVLQQGLRKCWEEIAELNQSLSVSSAEIASLTQRATERDSMASSTSWRMTRPLRAAVGILRGEPAYIANLRNMRNMHSQPQSAGACALIEPQSETPAEVTFEAPAGTATDAPTGLSTALRIVYISGEAHTPGHYYRVVRYAESASAVGADVTMIRIEDSAERMIEIATAQVVVIWRAAWSERVAAVIATARQAGARIVFDVDDLLIDPELARREVVDGIRSQNFAEEQVRELFVLMRRTMMEADLCTVTTEGLAAHIRRVNIPTLVLPNGFDEATLTIARLAARRRAAAPSDGLLRIGYASGSATHQHDFALCAPAVAEALRLRPHARLVLFWDNEWHRPLLDIKEFPELLGLDDQIEWRDRVPLDRLPEEVARFDVNLAPLEVGNLFCEAKSELKFFEAALCDVCTIASPTEPFRRAMRHGETGFLAGTVNEWREALAQLLDDSGLRSRMARAAYRDTLWTFGPERRAERVASMFDHLRGGRAAARAFALDLQAARQPAPLLSLPEYETVFRSDRLGHAEATVIVPLHNYAHYVETALDSVAQQTLRDLDLIVIDDASSDDGLGVACRWAEINSARFNRLLVLRNLSNAGLGPTRNLGFDVADTPFVLPLDADNRLLPDCLTRCLATIRTARAAYAYPVIRQFGAAQDTMGVASFDPLRLIAANFIDAMALVSKAAWTLIGGYDNVRYGWEDYDFWCRLAEHGLTGEAVGGDPLAEYRVHGASMLRTTTDSRDNKRRLIEDFEQRHPWVGIINRPASHESRAVPANPNDGARLASLLELLRCPETSQPLEFAENGGLRTADGARHWPVLAGRPILFPGVEAPSVHPADHISNPLPPHVVDRIRATDGLVLNLSAGGTAERLPNVIEVEAAIFRHTDLVADAHHLPFADQVFDGILALNAFEHYAEPQRAAAEIHRLLKPGGWVLIQTAFLQPAHETPWHFYNCTKHGLLHWFADFAVEQIHVSENFNPVYAIAWLASECESALRLDISPIAADGFQSTPIGALVAAWRDAGQRSGQVWDSFHSLSQSTQDAIAAGFEFVGRRVEK
ncbi:class I SAM-dependent methyltransferase [uncultured Thiodictyon sp.]|uniref:class I SAM-dependent methyltransferase n=1 Tax=uncultured Thiodictyon sp. TaxID=1846217 RepID=UPI0025FA6440|nr:class I SAM-dependent methyltransferase [uncultured Thiodictyon sp.]